MNTARIDPTDVERARNHLSEVVSSAVKLKRKGGPPVGLCPFHNEKTASFTLYPNHYYCFGSDAHGDAIDFVKETQGLDFTAAVQWILGTDLDNAGSARKPSDPAILAKREAEREVDERRRIQHAQRIWREAKDPAGTVVEIYLRSRAITLSPIPHTIRFANLRHGPTGLLLPAMVCAVQGPGGKVVGCHRTSLRPDGKVKAPVTPNKMMLGKCGGGAVRLAAASEELTITEGIETALAVMLATGRPVWAALSTSGIRSLVLPPNIRQVIIAADGDKPGIDAAEAAAARWMAEGRDVRIARAPDGCDFADVIAGDVFMESCRA